MAFSISARCCADCVTVPMPMLSVNFALRFGTNPLSVIKKNFRTSLTKQKITMAMRRMKMKKADDAAVMKKMRKMSMRMKKK